MEENKFNFAIEAAEIDPDMVTSLQLTEVEEGMRCLVELVSLEHTSYQLTWTVQNGI